MLKLRIETASVRVAAFPEGDRLLTVRATCRGPAWACASARLAPRRHETPPEDGLWDIDLVCDGGDGSGEIAAWRDVVFTGEADWCEGVRLHSPGGVLEHRIAPQAARIATRPAVAPRWTPPPRPIRQDPSARRRFSLFRLALDGTAAAMILGGLALLPLAMPANAGPHEGSAQAHAGCHHFRPA